MFVLLTAVLRYCKSRPLTVGYTKPVIISILHVTVLKLLNFFALRNIAKILMQCPKNRQKWDFCPLISYRGPLPKCKGDVFYCRRTYVAWRSLKKISVETADRMLGKTGRKIKWSLSVQRGQTYIDVLY